MEPEEKKIEIKVVDESAYEAPVPEAAPEGYAAVAGGKAEVTVRLLTQEEFDRLQREKAMKEMGFKLKE